MDTVESALKGVHSDKASKDKVDSLEDSQHRVLEEVVALQKVLACKVDRVELPLLVSYKWFPASRMREASQQ